VQGSQQVKAAAEESWQHQQQQQQDKHWRTCSSCKYYVAAFKGLTLIIAAPSVAAMSTTRP
jgi:hypothetical protein